MSDKQKLTEKLVQEARKGSPTSLRSLLYYLLAVVYVVSPLDFVPDVLPGLGQMDDVAVIIGIIIYVVRLLKQKK